MQIIINRKNWNRYKAGTHTKAQIAKLEGLEVDGPIVTNPKTGRQSVVKALRFKKQAIPQGTSLRRPGRPWTALLAPVRAWLAEDRAQTEDSPQAREEAYQALFRHRAKATAYRNSVKGESASGLPASTIRAIQEAHLASEREMFKAKAPRWNRG